jgi:hypothetical protein
MEPFFTKRPSRWLPELKSLRAELRVLCIARRCDLRPTLGPQKKPLNKIIYVVTCLSRSLAKAALQFYFSATLNQAQSLLQFPHFKARVPAELGNGSLPALSICYWRLCSSSPLAQHR